MARSFAISDIHGCAKTFISMVEKTIQLEKEDRLYLLGDYIDRGPDSKGVIDYIIQLREQGYNVRTIKGNHEQMLLDAYNNRSDVHLWLMNGGDAAADSFKIVHLKDLEDKYLEFFQNLEEFIVLDSFVLVHAGLNFKIEDVYSDKEAMLWLRKFTVDPELIGGRTLIHGHTPQPVFKIEEDISLASVNYVIGIDGGCVFTGNEFYGHLCALELEQMKVYFEKNKE